MYGRLLLDYYYIYWSSDMNTPIDRTDPSTYDGEIDYKEQSSYLVKDSEFPFVEGTQYHFAIYFYDNSKGIFSPKAVPTDPVVPASYENLTVDNVTVCRVGSPMTIRPRLFLVIHWPIPQNPL